MKRDLFRYLQASKLNRELKATINDLTAELQQKVAPVSPPKSKGGSEKSKTELAAKDQQIASMNVVIAKLREELVCCSFNNCSRF